VPAADRPAPLADPGAGDTARAETALPLPAADVAAFVRDIERLWRLNPHLEIITWQASGREIRLVAHNELNDRRLDTRFSVDAAGAEPGCRLTLRYADGLRQATEILVEPGPGGARLVVTDRYPRIDDPQDPRLVDVDRSLVPWVAAIRRHVLKRRRWGWLPGWRWWNERFLPGMAPRSRRIVRLLVWISLLEFLVFLGAVLVLRLSS